MIVLRVLAVAALIVAAIGLLESGENAAARLLRLAVALVVGLVVYRAMARRGGPTQASRLRTRYRP